MFSVANTSLFRTTFVESFGFWFVTSFAKSVWVVFWEDFFTFDSDTFTSVVFTTGGGKFFFVNKLLSFWTNMIFIETAALSEGSDIFTGGFTVVVTATWHANIVVLVPFVSDWVVLTFMGTFLWWADTLFLGASASGSSFDSFDGTVRWANWILNDDWTVFFAFTGVNFATVFIIDKFTIVEFFFFGTDWNRSVFVWEHDGAFVWVSFIDTLIRTDTSPMDTTISPV